MAQKQFEYFLPIRLQGTVTDRDAMHAFCSKGLPASAQDPFLLISWDQSLNRVLEEAHYSEQLSARRRHIDPPVIPKVTDTEFTFHNRFQEPDQGTLRIYTDRQLTHREEILLAQSVDQSLNLASLYLSGRPFLSEDFQGMKSTGNSFVTADTVEHRFTYEVGFQSIGQRPVRDMGEANERLYDRMYPDGNVFHSQQVDALIERLRQDPAGEVNPEILSAHMFLTDEKQGVIEIQTDAPVTNTAPLEQWSFQCMNQILNQDPFFADQQVSFQLSEEKMRLHQIAAADPQQENPLQLTEADLEGLSAEEGIKL